MFIGWAGCFAHISFSSARHLGFSKGSALRSTWLQIAFAITSIGWWLVIYIGLLDSHARLITAFLADHKQNVGLLVGAHVPKQVKELSAILEANKLKKIHSMVDGGSIDAFGGGQGIVALHGWSYRPRPILQEHMAYTPKLTAINGDFLRTKDAAEWILYRASAIDNRYPGAEDPLALQALLECYSPAEVERGYVLLRRKECSRIHGEEALGRLERTVSVGEKVPVKRCPEPCIRKVYVHLDRGIFSRIAAMLLREPEYAVVLGVGEERRIEFRMPPRAWETGVIIDPLLFDTSAIVAWYSTRSPNVLVDSVEIKVRTNRPQWLLPARARVAVVSYPM